MLASVPLVLGLVSLVIVVCDANSPSASVSKCEMAESQTSSPSRRREAGVSLECQQCKKTKAGMETTLPVGTQENASEGGA